MGLITKEVEIVVNSKTIKHYRELGYEIIKDEWHSASNKIKIKVEHLTDGSHSKVDIKCDGCGKELTDMPWKDYKRYVRDDGKYYCVQCSHVLSNNHNKFTEEDVRKIVNEKLGIDWKIHEIKVIKRHTNVELEDTEGYWYDNVNISSVKFRDKPRRFHKSNTYTEYNINRYCEINVLPIRLHKDKRSTIDNKHNKAEWYCLDCGKIFERTFDAVRNGQTSCPCCSDNISYPEKFGLSFFNQLNINYIYNSKLKWSENYRYDFIIDNLKLIVETHGGQHYEESFSRINGAKTLEEEQENDRLKKELAVRNGYKYIEIDCRKSDMTWIKNNILDSELIKLFDLSNIDWLQIHEKSCKNLVKIVCDMWNNGIRNTLDISKIIKLSRSSITTYLKQGTELGWCDYNPIDAKKDGYKKNSIEQSKIVIQLSLEG